MFEIVMSATPSSQPSLFARLVREPLVHFIALGGLVFGVDHAIRTSQQDPLEIVVSPEVEIETRDIFRTAKGREPSAAEMQVLRERWIDNEVLYREGLALRLDQGDPTLRERIIFKALNVIESNLRLPESDDTQLKAWFEQHRDQYDIPARFDFSEAVPQDSRQETLTRFADALNHDKEVDIQSSLRLFEHRPQNNIADAFGAEFANTLETVPLQTWQVLSSRDGLRLIKVDKRESGESVSFDSVRARVVQDWRDATAAELRTAAVRDLGKKYKVRVVAGGSS